jgi:RNA-directed DNA polymerase
MQNYANLKETLRDSKNALFHPLDERSLASIRWNTIENNIAKLQHRIMKATQEGKSGVHKTRNLQRLLVRSLSAQMKAIQQTTQKNSDKNIPEIYSKFWLNQKQKLQASLDLHKNKRIIPLVWAYRQKKNKGEQPSEISYSKLQITQNLRDTNLTSTLKTNSRNLPDNFNVYSKYWNAHSQVKILLSETCSNEWILIMNLEECFNLIQDNGWLLKNIPTEKTILRNRLKTGLSEEPSNFPNDACLTPTALYKTTILGLNSFLFKTLPSTTQKEQNKCIAKIESVLSQNTCIIRGASYRQLEKVKLTIVNFLRTRGLDPHLRKIKISHIHNGFDFLGWTFRKTKNGSLLHSISKNSTKLHWKMLRDLIKNSGNIQPQGLIKKLNPVIKKWCNYHQCCSNVWKIWSRSNQYLFRLLLKWCRKRHPRKSKTWIYNKYWKSVKNRNTFGILSEDDLVYYTLTPHSSKIRTNRHRISYRLNDSC